ncbi:MAG: DUF5606 domain-containing protein [Prevotellaceae bacterium]|jgi:hypothetical protein|nr:DUF5606 domain-containing protein [Prevotellaceae bacterium]
MLKEILSISGKPGLFRLISQGKNMLIVESLVDKKRQPAYSHEKLMSLADVAIYTDSGEKPLSEVFALLFEKENGQKASIDPKSPNDTLRAYFAEILPDFDRDRVYPTDIKKLILWYNLLVDCGITDFSKEEENTAEATAE